MAIRHVLYWSFVQELVKIVADENCRVPSIHNLRDHLADRQVKTALQKKYSAWGFPAKEADTPDANEFWKSIEMQHELDGQRAFELLYDKAMKDSEELLKSAALASMKEVRDKLLAHNELKFQDGSYRFIDIQSYGLKYGDERVLLEKASRVFDGFFALVSRATFEWDCFNAMIELDAKQFWKE